MPLSVLFRWMIEPRFKAGAFFIHAAKAGKAVVESWKKSAIIQGINAAQGILAVSSADGWLDQGLGKISVIKQ